MKQRELQPWTAKINAKQSEVDIASSECDALAKKAQDLKAASEEAQANWAGLKTDQEAKVDSFFLSLTQNSLILICYPAQTPRRFQSAESQFAETAASSSYQGTGTIYVVAEIECLPTNLPPGRRNQSPALADKGDLVALPSQSG